MGHWDGVRFHLRLHHLKFFGGIYRTSALKRALVACFIARISQMSHDYVCADDSTPHFAASALSSKSIFSFALLDVIVLKSRLNLQNLDFNNIFTRV